MTGLSKAKAAFTSRFKLRFKVIEFPVLIRYSVLYLLLSFLVILASTFVILCLNVLMLGLLPNRNGMVLPCRYEHHSI